MGRPHYGAITQMGDGARLRSVAAARSAVAGITHVEPESRRGAWPLHVPKQGGKRPGILELRSEIAPTDARPGDVLSGLAGGTVILRSGERDK